MTTPDAFRSSFGAMTDGELVARWARHQLTDEAQAIAAQELRSRGIDPDEIDMQGELERQAHDAVSFRRGQRQRAGRISLRFLMTIFAAVLSAFGATVAALIFR
ncbi:hypothetical protein V8017_13240 [Stenotrophomonas rhizophila]